MLPADHTASVTIQWPEDASGRVVAEATGGDWTCTTYDTRDRPIEEKVPKSASALARTVTHNYAVGGDPLTSSVSDDKGTITTTVDLLGRTVAYTDATGARTATRRIQAMIATSGGTSVATRLSNWRAGVAQPRVLRGRVLSSAATAARSVAVWTDRSVPFGKYWRSRPFVFSFEPRCHGLAGSQK